MKTALTVAAALAAATLLPAQDACRDTAEDRLNWVRERLRPDTDKTELQEILRYLTFATKACFTNGDLWYFRSQVENRLGQGKNADFSLKKISGSVKSQAMATKMDVFGPAPPPTRPLKVPPYVREKWALVIGVGQFADKSVQALRFTTKDAQDFADLLTDPNVGRFKKENVKVLLNEKATVRGIREGIGWLRDAKEDDLVVIYMSSHGSPRQMDTQGVSYLIAHDTEIGTPAKLYATSYQMVDLVQDLTRDIKAARLTLILDACHSGAAAEQVAGARALVAEAADASTGYSTVLAQIQSGAGRAILTASRADQQSWESEKLNGGKGNGFFTYYLLEAMRQNNGLLPINKVYEHLKAKVHDAVVGAGHKAQDPLLTTSEQGGEIILGVAPKPTQALLRQ